MMTICCSGGQKPAGMQWLASATSARSLPVRRVGVSRRRRRTIQLGLATEPLRRLAAPRAWRAVRLSHGAACPDEPSTRQINPQGVAKRVAAHRARRTDQRRPGAGLANKLTPNPILSAGKPISSRSQKSIQYPQSTNGFGEDYS